MSDESVVETVVDVVVDEAGPVDELEMVVVVVGGGTNVLDVVEGV